MLEIPDKNSHFVHRFSPLRNEFDEQKLFDFPVFRNPQHFDFSILEKQVETYHANDKVAAVWIGRLFETAWPIRGYENFLVDMIANEEISNYFFDNEHKWNMHFAAEAAKAGADMFYFGDDVGMQNSMIFSSELWRKYANRDGRRFF